MGAVETDQFIDFKTGNEHAFRFFYEKYYHALCLFVLKILRDEEHMHDIVQDAFITLWNTHETLETELHLKMFLYQVVRNRCLNVLKNKKVEERYVQEYLLLNEDADFANRVLEEEAHRMVIQEIMLLPEEQRKVVLLHLEGKDNAEIAELMHISVNTVKTHKARARKTLKIRLGELFIWVVIWGL